MSEQNKNNIENVKEEEFVIDVEPTGIDDRDSVAVQQFITTESLKSAFDAPFKAYADFAGVRFFPTNKNTLEVRLYFKKLRPDEIRDGEFYAFLPNGTSGSKHSDDTWSRIQNFQAIQKTGAGYHITKVGKEGIDDFIARNYKDSVGKVKWAEAVPTSAQEGGYNVIVGVDVNKLYKKTVGDKRGIVNPETGDIQYRKVGVEFNVRGVHYEANGAPVYHIMLTLIDMDTFDALAKFGGYNGFGGGAPQFIYDGGTSLFS